MAPLFLRGLLKFDLNKSMGIYVYLYAVRSPSTRQDWLDITGWWFILRTALRLMCIKAPVAMLCMIHT